MIVCTYNRADVLANCLRHLQQVEYPECEILVVNGPSDDRTEEVLKGFPGINCLSTNHLNISKSRNVGLKAARGELIAFVDDDAEVAADWLQHLSRCFTDQRVGGAGGRVFRDEGRTEFQNGLVNRYGRVQPARPEIGTYNDPDGEWFNTVQGTNCAFRKSALDEIGLFDGAFRYYHDEADVCFRLIQAGWRIVHCPQATVRHLTVAGPQRRSKFDVNWETVMRSSLYFALRSQAKKPPLVPKVVAVVAFWRLKELTAWLLRGRIGPILYLRSLGRVLRGLAAGLALWRGSRAGSA